MTRKHKLITTVDCPKCKANLEIYEDKEIIEPAQAAVTEITYHVIVSNQSKLFKELKT